MTIVALLLTPVVLLYQGWTYYVFRHRDRHATTWRRSRARSSCSRASRAPRRRRADRLTRAGCGPSIRASCARPRPRARSSSRASRSALADGARDRRPGDAARAHRGRARSSATATSPAVAGAARRCSPRRRSPAGCSRGRSRPAATWRPARRRGALRRRARARARSATAPATRRRERRRRDGGRHGHRRARPVLRALPAPARARRDRAGGDPRPRRARSTSPSAVIMAATVPLIPIFGILVGRDDRATGRARATPRWRALSTHFLDVVRGLPTLRAFNRGAAQAERLAETRRGLPARDDGHAARSRSSRRSCSSSRRRSAPRSSRSRSASASTAAAIGLASGAHDPRARARALRPAAQRRRAVPRERRRDRGGRPHPRRGSRRRLPSPCRRGDAPLDPRDVPVRLERVAFAYPGRAGARPRRRLARARARASGSRWSARAARARARSPGCCWASSGPAAAGCSSATTDLADAGRRRLAPAHRLGAAAAAPAGRHDRRCDPARRARRADRRGRGRGPPRGRRGRSSRTCPTATRRASATAATGLSAGEVRRIALARALLRDAVAADPRRADDEPRRRERRRWSRDALERLPPDRDDAPDHARRELARRVADRIVRHRRAAAS